MREPLKKGDRVAVYANGRRITGVVDRLGKGSFFGQVYVSADSGVEYGEWAHPSQCRRLVKKKRREWWITVRKTDGKVTDVSEVPLGDLLAPWELVHVREVGKRGGV